MKKFIGNKDFYKLVAALALPLLLQNAVSTFVNLLDNLMVGRIGTESMSGVSIVCSYITSVSSAARAARAFSARSFSAAETITASVIRCASISCSAPGLQ